jgi:hypothetical protein
LLIAEKEHVKPFYTDKDAATVTMKLVKLLSLLEKMGAGDKFEEILMKGEREQFQLMMKYMSGVEEGQIQEVIKLVKDLNVLLKLPEVRFDNLVTENSHKKIYLEFHWL